MVEAWRYVSSCSSTCVFVRVCLLGNEEDKIPMLMKRILDTESMCTNYVDEKLENIQIFQAIIKIILFDKAGLS